MAKISNNLGAGWWNTEDNLRKKADEDALFLQTYGIPKEDFVEGYRLRNTEETAPEAAPAYNPPPAAAAPFVYDPKMDPMLNPLAPKAAPGGSPLPQYAPPAPPVSDKMLSDWQVTDTGLGFAGPRSTTPDTVEFSPRQKAARAAYSEWEKKQKETGGLNIVEDAEGNKFMRSGKGFKQLTAPKGALTLGVEGAKIAKEQGFELGPETPVATYKELVKGKAAGIRSALAGKFDQAYKSLSDTAKGFAMLGYDQLKPDQKRVYDTWLSETKKRGITLADLEMMGQAEPEYEWGVLGRMMGWKKGGAAAAAADKGKGGGKGTGAPPPPVAEGTLRKSGPDTFIRKNGKWVKQ